MKRSTAEKMEQNVQDLGVMGCCSRFLECSEKRQCLYPSDSDFYKNCVYRRNLENGKVFYGKNANHGFLPDEEQGDVLNVEEFLCSLGKLDSPINIGSRLCVAHAAYGNVLFDVVQVEETPSERIATLCSHYALDGMPFDNPKDQEPAGIPEHRTAYPADTRQYGSGQWYRSDLRRYLNSSSMAEPCCRPDGGAAPGFLLGLDSALRGAMIPTCHATYRGEYPKNPVSRFLYEIPPYELKPSGVAVTWDDVYLPSAAEMGLHRYHEWERSGDTTLPYFMDKEHLVKGGVDRRRTLLRLRDSVPGSCSQTAVINTFQMNVDDCNASACVPFTPMLRVSVSITVPPVEREKVERPWNWNSMDKGRIIRAQNIKLLNYQADSASCSASAVGSSGEVYYFTLESCTCRDFVLHHGKQPCKHIIRLAMEAGILNQEGRTPEDQRHYDIKALQEQIAISAGYYYVFNQPVMSDAEYDRMKEKLRQLTKK